MALVVEDGSIVTGANSYVSLADSQAYVTDRGFLDEISGEPIQLTEGHLLRAVDYINAHRKVFKGIKQTSPDLDMQWPRREVEIDEYDLPPNVIPQCIIHAQIETAIEIAQDRDPFETISSERITREKIDVIEYEYDLTQGDGEQPSFDYKTIRALLRPVIDTGYGRTSR